MWRARPVVLLSLALLAAPAAAQIQVDTSRSNNFELKFGGYMPEIDSEFSLAEGQRGPYERVFGGSSETLTLAVWEAHIVNEWGTLAAGLGGGYWNVAGKGISSGEATDTTEMTMWPVLAQLSYRFDLIQDYLPIVPVFRIGLDYYMWEILRGDGETARFSEITLDAQGRATSTAPGAEAKGGTWGWHGAIGLHILLDYFAPQMAADFDRDAGVNHSYLVLEYHHAQIDDFGSAESFRLGDDLYFFGLALDL
ncbi:hypothetical protein KKF91_21830 [Myxococcota bacterium]|nr:hypothetical protein [Myxococcota bacterium]MBU1433186.1 hypothetical protein [Myxococcota bacterium]MBU1896189.1 hypothetical protein [Myxococcota bacterium]